MRRTLSILFLAIAVAMVAATVTAGGEINWSAGVTLTEKEAGVSMGTRLAAIRIEMNSFGRVREHVFGGWFSTTSMFPEIAFSKSVGYDAYADFSNIRNVERVVVSPDSGITEWEAFQVPLWGWTARLGELPPGPHALQWGVYSRDKKNRLVLFIIPINWTSRRETSAVQQLNVLRPPVGCDSYSDEEWLALLRGFRPVDAQFDPQFLAMKQARAQMERTTQPKQVETFEPPPAPPVLPAHEEPVRVELKYSEILMVFNGNDVRELPITIDTELARGDKLTFKRSGRFVAEAVVIQAVPGKYLEARITKGGGVRTHDEIFLKGGK